MVDWYLLGDAVLTIGGGTTFASTSWMRANAVAEFHAVTPYRGCETRSGKGPDDREPSPRMTGRPVAVTEDMGL